MKQSYATFTNCVKGVRLIKGSIGDVKEMRIVL